MVWAILALIGGSLWLCAAGIFVGALVAQRTVGGDLTQAP